MIKASIRIPRTMKKDDPKNLIRPVFPQVTVERLARAEFVLCPHCNAPVVKVEQDSFTSCFQDYWLSCGDLLDEAYQPQKSFDFNRPRSWDVFWYSGNCPTCLNDYFVMEALVLTAFKDGDAWNEFHREARTETMLSHRATYRGQTDDVPRSWVMTEEKINGSAVLHTHYIGPFPSYAPQEAANFFREIKTNMHQIVQTSASGRSKQ